jgi:spore germination protein YaaH
MAIVTTYLGDRFHPLAIRQLAADPPALARAAGTIAAYARESRYAGLILDFETLAPSDVAALVRVANAISDSTHAHGVSPVAIAIPATDTAAYPAAPLLAAVDLAIVMLYDEHWTSSPPGPIASPDWVRRALGTRVAEVGAGKLVAGLPLYGYRWRAGHLTDVLSHADAERIAGAAGLRLEREPASGSLHARRTDDPNSEWELWVSDAELLRTLMKVAQDAGVRRFALWRLGGEDERIWTR